MHGVSFRFGPFTLDSGTRQLLSGGDEVHLSPKAFELLSILLESQPRAVSKAELQERLWPTTYVAETNLASLVAEIRRALRDSATRPAFVRTVYRFGYRFVGDVETDGAARAGAPAAGAVACVVFENRQTALLPGSNVIGRAPDAAVLCNAAGVSRHHARIVLTQSEATLEDLGSKNGTYLRGERVTSARLSDGDEIKLGMASLTFRFISALGATDSVPIARTGGEDSPP